jgi:hypothetical protein
MGHSAGQRVLRNNDQNLFNIGFWSKEVGDEDASEGHPLAVFEMNA